MKFETYEPGDGRTYNFFYGIHCEISAKEGKKYGIYLGEQDGKIGSGLVYGMENEWQIAEKFNCSDLQAKMILFWVNNKLKEYSNEISSANKSTQSNKDSN